MPKRTAHSRHPDLRLVRNESRPKRSRPAGWPLLLVGSIISLGLVVWFANPRHQPQGSMQAERSEPLGVDQLTGGPSSRSSAVENPLADTGVDLLLGTNEPAGAKSVKESLGPSLDQTLGKTVKVKGAVARVIDRKSFALRAPGINESNRLLVLHPGAFMIGTPPREGHEVVVKGKLTRFQMKMIGNGRGAAPDSFAPFAGDPVVRVAALQNADGS